MSMNKKIKSLLVAGLLVVGMGFATVDSYAAEVTNSITEFNFADIDNGGPLASVHTLEGGKITITIRDVGGYSGHPEGAHEISANWDTSVIDMKSIDVVTWFNAIEESKQTTKLDLQDGQAFLRINVQIEQAIDAINLEYEVAGSEGEQEPTVSFDDAEQKVINKYRESMTSVGVLNNGERQIDTSFMIEKDAWLDFIEGVNGADNYVTIEEGEEKGEYHVYTNVSEEKKLIEVIFIDFFDSESKGWVPEITPGTGQAIAVGGMVVLAAAGVGLLVNNKKKKDEEK